MKTKTILSICIAVFLFSATGDAQVKRAASKKTSAKAGVSKTKPAAKKAVLPVKPKSPFESALEKIKSDDASQRRQAAREFARLRDKRAEEPLIAALKDKSSIVRNAAVDALGLLRSRKAVPEISRLLLKDPEENVRYIAAVSLSYIGGTRAGDALIKAIDDKSKGVRYAAVRTLAVLRYKKAEEKLIQFLKSKDINMRRSVINTLGRIGSKKAVSGIVKNRENKDIYVRVEVAKALGEIGDIESIPVLKKMLDDKEAKVSIEAAYSLAKMNDKSGLDMAHKSIKSSDRVIKQRSADIMGQIGGKKSLKVLDKAYKAATQANVKAFINFAKERVSSRLKMQEKK